MIEPNGKMKKMEQVNNEWGNMRKDTGLGGPLGGLCIILLSKNYNKQGKSEGFDSCDRPSNLTQIGFKSSILLPVWPWHLMDDTKKQ